MRTGCKHVCRSTIAAKHFCEYYIYIYCRHISGAVIDLDDVIEIAATATGNTRKRYYISHKNNCRVK